MTTGRPTLYSDELVQTICKRIAEGESLVSITTDDDRPGYSTVMAWLAAHKEFQEKYAHAREVQADFYADEIIEIAKKRDLDNPLPNGRGGYGSDTTAVQRDRLIVDALKWKASKLAPKKYGEKIQQEVTGADGTALIPSITVNVKGKE